MTRTGWDFSNPIREDYDKDNKSGGSSGDPRKAKRMLELKKICEAISKKSGRFTLNGLRKVVDDMEDYDRFARRVKELEKMGIVKKYGRGQDAWYKLDKKASESLQK